MEPQGHPYSIKAMVEVLWGGGFLSQLSHLGSSSSGRVAFRLVRCRGGRCSHPCLHFDHLRRHVTKVLESLLKSLVRGDSDCLRQVWTMPDNSSGGDEEGPRPPQWTARDSKSTRAIDLHPEILLLREKAFCSQCTSSKDERHLGGISRPLDPLPSASIHPTGLCSPSPNSLLSFLLPFLHSSSAHTLLLCPHAPSWFIVQCSFQLGFGLGSLKRSQHFFSVLDPCCSVTWQVPVGTMARSAWGGERHLASEEGLVASRDAEKPRNLLELWKGKRREPLGSGEGRRSGTPLP